MDATLFAQPTAIRASYSICWDKRVLYHATEARRSSIQ
jgi:hypothetical protein